MLITVDTIQYNLSETYVRNVLGIDPCLLTEGVIGSTAVQRLIISEHLLYESFFSTAAQKFRDLKDATRQKIQSTSDAFKEFGGGLKAIQQGLYAAATDDTGESWKKILEAGKAWFTEKTQIFFDFFALLKDRFTDWMEENTPTFYKAALWIEEKVTSIKDMLGQLSAGWKSALKALAICVGMAWLIKQVKVERIEKIKASLENLDSPEVTVMKVAAKEFTSMVGDEIKKKLTGKLKEIGASISTGGVADFVKALAVIAGGVALVVSTIAPILSAVGNKLPDPITGDEDEDGINESLTYERLRSIIRNHILEENKRNYYDQSRRQSKSVSQHRKRRRRS